MGLERQKGESLMTEFFPLAMNLDYKHRSQYVSKYLIGIFMNNQIMKL